MRAGDSGFPESGHARGRDTGPVGNFRLTSASDFGGEIAGSGHLLLCPPQVDHVYRSYYNDRDGLTCRVEGGGTKRLVASIVEVWVWRLNS